MTLRMNHNRRTALERSIISYWAGCMNRFYPRAALALGSSVIHELQLFSLINASKQQIYKSRFNTEMKPDAYLTTRQTLKRCNNMNPTVEPRWADPRKSIKHQPTHLIVFTPNLWCRCAIKEGSKVVNRDWVKHQTSSLSHNNPVVFGSFITNNYFPKISVCNEYVCVEFGEKVFLSTFINISEWICVS